ncbi:hypothetical protein [Corallibacter sp.]|uniref:hypothetical protein n=1 Tax=Corallibacter sp. TaxID=2038084 RepID=UPI003AB4CBA3
MRSIKNLFFALAIILSTPSLSQNVVLSEVNFDLGTNLAYFLKSNLEAEEYSKALEFGPQYGFETSHLKAYAFQKQINEHIKLSCYAYFYNDNVVGMFLFFSTPRTTELNYNEKSALFRPYHFSIEKLGKYEIGLRHEGHDSAPWIFKKNQRTIYYSKNWPFDLSIIILDNDNQEMLTSEKHFGLSPLDLKLDTSFGEYVFDFGLTKKEANTIKNVQKHSMQFENYRGIGTFTRIVKDTINVSTEFKNDRLNKVSIEYQNSEKESFNDLLNFVRLAMGPFTDTRNLMDNKEGVITVSFWHENEDCEVKLVWNKNKQTSTVTYNSKQL